MNYDPNTGQPIMNSNQQPIKQAKTNGFAIAGLICSIFVGSILGFIFSIIGLVKSKTYGSGKGMSIAGVIISTLRLIGTIAIVTVFSGLIWPAIKGEIVNAAHCDAAFDCKSTGDGYADCKYYDENKNKQSVRCQYDYAGGTTTTKVRTTTTEKTTTERITTTTNNQVNKVNLYVFYGYGCPHCEDLLNYLKELEKDSNYNYMYNLVTYETFYNESNAELLKKMYNYYGVTDPQEMGVPLYIIGDKHYVGFPNSSQTMYYKNATDEIKSALINAYNNTKYVDVVEQVRKA